MATQTLNRPELSNAQRGDCGVIRDCFNSRRIEEMHGIRLIGDADRRVAQRSLVFRIEHPHRHELVIVMVGDAAARRRGAQQHGRIDKRAV